jgi:tetratricopeptide (TPR) repeat protein
MQKLPSVEVDPANGESSSSENKVNPIINRWHARGMTVFGNDDEIVRGVGDLVIYQNYKDGKKPLLYSDDIAAILSAEMRLGKEDEVNLSRHLQIADSYPFESKLRLQVAITLSNTKPLEAINILNQYNEQIRSKENPYRAIANAYSAKISAQNNQIEDAKSSIDTAIEIWPNEPRWQIIAADIYIKLGNITEAIHHVDESISLEPNYLDYHLKLGKLLTEHSDIDHTYPTRAIQTLERACRLEPEAPKPWLYLSRAYLIMMEIEQAVTCADMAITLAPDSHQPLAMRGEIALHQDTPMTALEYADQALEIKPQDLQAIIIKSQALKDLGRASEALEVLESVMENMEDPLSIHIEYALLLNDVRGPQASIQALEELVEQHPDDPIILHLLAKNMAEAGEIDAAIHTAQQALQTNNGNLHIREKAELHYILGKLLFQVRQLDQAIDHLSESITLIPNFVEPYLELGHSYQERRQFRQALDAYQKATQIAPNDFRPYYHAGIALKDGKDYQSSESMLRRAADLAPDDVNIRRQLAAVVALNLVHNPRPQRIVEE